MTVYVPDGFGGLVQASAPVDPARSVLVPDGEGGLLAADFAEPVPLAPRAVPAPLVDGFAVDVAGTLLALLVDELGGTVGGSPARYGIYPGEEIAPMDECCAGQAAVRVHRIYPITGRFPQQNYGPKDCSALSSYAVLLEMTVYRCASTIQGDGSPPTVEHLTADARIQLDDAAAMRAAIRRLAAAMRSKAYSGDTQYLEDDYNPVGPAGDCVGGRQRVTVQVYDLR